MHLVLATTRPLDLRMSGFVSPYLVHQGSLRVREKRLALLSLSAVGFKSTAFSISPFSHRDALPLSYPASFEAREGIEPPTFPVRVALPLSYKACASTGFEPITYPCDFRGTRTPNQLVRTEAHCPLCYKVISVF